MPRLMQGEIRELSRRDIDALLARHSVGRLAFTRNGEVDIVPINYVYAGGLLYGRTSPDGGLLKAGASDSGVAFEVDEIHSLRQWISVVARGTLHPISEQLEREEWLRTIGLMRRFSPEAFRAEDLSPERTELFRIVFHELNGRALG